MKFKVYYVTTPADKRGTKHNFKGFVSVFGWESAEEKAAKKYPHLKDVTLYERPVWEKK